MKNFGKLDLRDTKEIIVYHYANSHSAKRQLFLTIMIEANANKYTFVWKKAVTKNQAKLLIKLADFVAECEQLYDIKIVYGNVVKIKHLKRLRKKLYALKNAGNITFVHGIGKRKTPLQKSIETLEEALSKLKEYTQKIHICGEKNSYSKTDIVT